MTLQINFNNMVDVNQTLYPKTSLKMSELAKEVLSIFMVMTERFEKRAYELVNEKDPISPEDFQANAFTKDFKQVGIVKKAMRETAIDTATLVQTLVDELDEVLDKKSNLHLPQDATPEQKKEAIKTLNELREKESLLSLNIEKVCRANAIFGAYYNCEVVEDAVIFDEIVMMVIEKILVANEYAGREFTKALKERNAKTDKINEITPEIARNIMREVIHGDEGSDGDLFKKDPVATAVESAK